MRKPIVAIIGRPNVGKSTLANRLYGAREAIVDSIPGVTRDRLYFDVEWVGHHFTIIDTGGIIPGEEDEISTSIFSQAKIATKQCDAVLFVVDGQEGPTPIDEEIANLLRQSGKPVFVAVNKIDSPQRSLMVSEFYSLGIGDPYPISAIHGTGGLGDLLDELIKVIPEFVDEEDEEKIPRLAIVGRPNVGKSSIINYLIGEKRIIVSDVAGTTRDTIDTPVQFNSKNYILTDTAGIRKKSKVEKGVEYYSVKRALKAIKDSDITLLISDATEGITDQDKKLAEYSNECGRALVIVVNKWDLIEDKDSNTINRYVDNIKEELPHATFSDIIFTSALSGQRLTKIFNLVDAAYENHSKTIPTSQLNQAMLEAVAINPPKSVQNKRLKIYYATQVNTNPPCIMLFVNKEKLLTPNYAKYIENQIRKSFDLSGTPIKIITKEKTERATNKIKTKG